MLKNFPEPKHRAKVLNTGWIRVEAGLNDQFRHQVDHRSTRRIWSVVKFSYQYSHGMGLNCLKNFHRSCSGSGWTNAHLLHQRYTPSAQACC